VITVIGPVVAWAGTTANSRVLENSEKVASKPLNMTFVTFTRLSPRIVTGAPLVSVTGLKEVIIGAAACAFKVKTKRPPLEKRPTTKRVINFFTTKLVRISSLVQPDNEIRPGAMQ